MDKVEIELRKQAVIDAVSQLRKAEMTARYFCGEEWARTKAELAHIRVLAMLDALVEVVADPAVQIGNGNVQINTFGGGA